MKRIVTTAADLERIREEMIEKLGAKKGLPASITIEVNPSKTLKEEEKVRVVMKNKPYQKMQALIKQCAKEVGWYGIVERKGEREFEITDIVMFPQTVTGATVETDDEEFVKWSNELSDEVYNNMKFYGHSHVNMGVSPSGTDLTFQDDLLQNERDFYIFGIFNKSGSTWWNIFDVRENILYEDKDVKFVREGVNEAEEWAKEMLEEFVKELKPASTKPLTSWGKKYDNHGKYNGYYGGNYSFFEDDERDAYRW